jgi:Nudix hydrolase domain
MNFSGLRGAFFVAWKTCVRADRRRIIRISTLILTLGCLNRPLTTSEGCIAHSAKSIKFTSVLAHQADKYDGIIISDVGLPETCNDFTSHLHYSLQLWKEKGVKGVWLKIPSRKLEYAAAAIDSGFTMHHAEKDYLMLTRWLSEDENKLPPNASHQIGVGCIVINDEGP